MVETGTATTGGSRPRYGGDVRISSDEWVKDERTGEMRLSEKGITRQKEDILALAGKLGGDIVRWYPENDTTAFKKRRVKLPNGRSVWRVFRPGFRQMLADYEDGVIDGVIFYDIDRLARQPRDLEDLIDLVEYYGRPVETVTGNIDLRTSNGRAMARVLVAMANKSSEDTSRRVARARLQQAQDGRNAHMAGARRRFGYRSDGTLIAEEANLIRDAAKRFLAGESWGSLIRLFAGSGVRPVYARDWRGPSVRQILLSPTVAGIAMYNGLMRDGSQGRRRGYAYAKPEAVVLRDASGNYIKGKWEPILPVEQWEAVIAEYNRRHQGQTFSAHATRKYLLTGLLRCGRIRPDGSMCNRPLIGSVRRYPSGRVAVSYRCPGKPLGGCGGIDRSAPKMDALITDLLFAHIAANVPAASHLAPAPDENDPDAVELATVQQRLFTMRTGYARGTVSDDSMFSIVPELEARERKLKADLAKKAKTQISRASRAKSPDDVRAEWDEAADDVGVRRAILSRYLKAVVIRKSAKRGPGDLDYSAIEPIWRDGAEPDFEGATAGQALGWELLKARHETAPEAAP
jgi:site-specific DNA recombinase